MAELGLIAAVVQVADVGVRLSGTLYSFGQTVASADESIVFMSKDISHTCSILNTLGHNLKKDRDAQFYSQNAIDTAETIVKECLEIFREMDEALLRKIKRLGLDGSSSRVAVVALERLRWPFLRPKMMLLWSNLDKLKCSLDLMLNVFIYARLLVQRTEGPSVIDDQRSVIEHLLRTTAEQERKYESLKAAMDCKENVGVAESPTNGSIPVTPGLDTAILRTGVPSESMMRRLEAPEVDPTTGELENYCTLMERLLTEVEAEDYCIGHEMRSRIRNDVIHTHKREAQLLRAFHGDVEFQEKVREKSRRLSEMVEEKAAGEELQIAQRGKSSSGPGLASYGEDGPQVLDSNPRHSPRELNAQVQAKGYEGLPAMARRTLTSLINPSMDMFLSNRETPWSHFSLRSSRPTEQTSGLPHWIFGASNSAIHRILPLNPVTFYIQNDHIPQLPLLRSGTSMLVTEKSHDVATMASSQDLAALTDSTDTDTFESARSQCGDTALEPCPTPLIEDVEGGPLGFGDQGYGGSTGQDDGSLGGAHKEPSLNELLAAWVVST